MEYLVGLAIFVCGAFVGWKYREYTALKMVQELQMEELEEHIENKKIAITVERNADQWFIYKKEDGTFMAQGDTWLSVCDRMAERYPGKRFVIDEDNAAEVGLNL